MTQPDPGRLARLRILLFDVDGVLTDGRIVYDNSGNELKFFDVRDGQGLVLARRAGLRLGIITGRSSPVVDRRGRELGFEWIVQGSADKLADARAIAQEAGCDLQQVGYMGDDVVDLPLLRAAGWSAAPADAHPLVREQVAWVTGLPGGRGAVREVCEHWLHAAGHWSAVVGGLLGT